MSTLFIADLHLDAARPQATAAFLHFCAGRARQAEALYILGDLFESWVGDDDDSELADTVASALHSVAASGTPVSFVRGNRDFLLGPTYARRCGMQLLPDPAVALIAGVPTLLLHGDLLCSDDHEYQRFRTEVRSPAWQEQFLAQSLTERRAFAASARAASHAYQRTVPETITDANPDTVVDMLQRYGLSRMIHGHTHRPALHRHGECERCVLGDWYTQGSVLEVGSDARMQMHNLPFTTVKL